MSESRFRKKIPAGETATFCRQIALIMDAGIPIYDGIDSLVESCEDDRSREAFMKLSETYKETGSLYKTVEAAGYFPDYMVNMINIGEETGMLVDILKSLAVYYEREDRTKKTIKQAVTYPILLVCLMAAVIMVLVTRVMPIFENIFENLGASVTSAGVGIMNAGFAIGVVSLIVVVIVLVIVIVAVALLKLGKDKMIMRLICIVPGVKSLNKKMACGRFASVIGMMMGSGYSLEKALEMAPSIIGDDSVKDKINECAKLVNEGASFPDALNQIGLFDKMQSRIISVGYRAGQTETVMQQISESCETSVNDGIEKTVGYIEPCLVGLLSIVIGGILISVMLPLATIMSSIG